MPVDCSEEIDEPCHVAIVNDIPVNVDLLDPADHLDLGESLVA